MDEFGASQYDQLVYIIWFGIDTVMTWGAGIHQEILIAGGFMLIVWFGLKLSFRLFIRFVERVTGEAILPSSRGRFAADEAYEPARDGPHGRYDAAAERRSHEAYYQSKRAKKAKHQRRAGNFV